MKQTPEAACRKCRRTLKYLRRGLCARCYRWERANAKPPPAPAHASRHEPGTIGKIRDMARRRERGEQIFHQDDATIPIVYNF